MIEHAALVKILTKPAIQASMPIFVKIKDNISQYINDGISEYFINSINKYKDIKTLLHRQPTNFYDIYYPTTLLFNEKSIKTESVKDLFKDTNFITIIGDAGSGKSTLIKHLFITTFIESYKAPILVNLRDIEAGNNDLETCIFENILQNKLSPSDGYIKKLLDDGSFLFFLDGYDEIKAKDKQEITKKLEIFIDKYPKNSFILTSRPYSNIEYFKSFHNYSIQDLNKEDQILFVKLQIKDERLSKKIIESIKEVDNNLYINSFLKNSLLLTLYIMAYSKNSSIPSNKYVFYRRVFDVLFAEHDSATKIGFERDIKTQLNQESLEEVLKIFCFLSYFDNNFDFKKEYIFKTLETIKGKNNDLKFRNNDFIEDMKLSIGLWVEDCGIYSFSHRSMQEYFASVYVSNIRNLENKVMVYEKIVTISSDIRFNTDNFLALCFEMDEDFFIENYSIPIINRIRSLFITDEGILNYNFSYMNNGFNIGGTDNFSYSITDELMLIVGTIVTPNIKCNDFLKEVSIVFSKNIDNVKFNDFVKLKIIHENEPASYFLPKGDEITGEYIDFLSEIKINDVLNKIVNDIDKIKSELNSKLNKNKVIENDFINLI